MNRVLAHEIIRRLNGLFFLPGFVIGVHEFELNLAAQIAERVTRLESLENLYAKAVITTRNRLLGLLVRFGQALDFRLYFIVSGTGRKHSKGRGEHDQPRALLNMRDQFAAQIQLFHASGPLRSASIP